MAIEFRCTNCSSLLRVPDESAGKQAKCPKCQSLVIITAASSAASPSNLPLPAPPAAFPNPPSITPTPQTTDLFGSPDPSAAPYALKPDPSNAPWPQQQPGASYGAPHSTTQGAPYNASYGAPSGAPYSAPGAANPYQAPAAYQGQPGWGAMTATREAVLAKVKPPAIGLMIYAGLSVAIMVLNVVTTLLMPGGFNQGLQAAPNDAERVGQFVGFGLVIVLTLIIAALIFIGAPKMINLSSRGLALTAAIAACVPCNLCCVVGLPIGIWSIVVLLQPDVVAWFQMSSRGGYANPYGAPYYRG